MPVQRGELKLGVIRRVELKLIRVNADENIFVVPPYSPMLKARAIQLSFLTIYNRYY